MSDKKRESLTIPNQQYFYTNHMLTNNSTPKQSKPVNTSKYDGEFDAAIGLPPKTNNPEYITGYIRKVNETGNTPF